MTSAAAPDAPAADSGRIVLLTTSHRVAPGLLSWPAWETLRAADEVRCADAGHPQLPYLAEAGVTVRTGPLPAARELLDVCAGGRTVVVLADAAGEPALTDGLARLAGSGRERMPDLELLPGSYDLPGARLLDLVQVMAQIRAQCPWSSVRTHRDLVKYGIEEAYELVEAIEEGDRRELREELGDVLLQVVFHAAIAAEHEEEPFGIDDVAATIVEKLIHRHPHVFGAETAESPEDVKAHWLRTKAAEKRRTSVTEGVPLGQPALALAAKLAGRVRTEGLVVPLPELPGGAGIEGAGRAGEVGYELLALAVEAEAAGTDPESALRAASRAYRDAILAAEAADAGARGGGSEDDGPDSP
ncbi:nucleoside triphosphate pyrophosphohydrolase [Streptomyces sp. OF3]|uniref:Nucleoside triphosphate pyrophosphohydrolase n=1 Tax=Streptomyces alkaliterrae TaxID=2213162 RepID=A0A7W3WN42_9ACTN|nr:nucleoside triphosphate pyrophosphohydrolase [Streptomyces alkaliterrae]MBB1255398.1 nucleoside triphosphate pyrophosphohydrolase [Streptomyces alkaliterrae]